GQSDYALANEILNKVAHRVQMACPRCRVVAIDWGPWTQGMITPELGRLFEGRGVRLIERDDGVQTFLSLLTAPAPVQVVVGSSRLTPPLPARIAASTYRVHRTLSLEVNPFLRDHIIGGHPVLPTACAGTWMADTCTALFPG